MSKRLPVPPELEHLIEKREAEKERRRLERRGKDDQRKVDVGPLGALESAESLDDVSFDDRRSGDERREQSGRRKRRRRKSDS
jgi:hypothetical protein